MIQNKILECSSPLEATALLNTLKNSNKSFLKKNPNYLEDYSIIISESIKLKYSITNISELV